MLTGPAQTIPFRERMILHAVKGKAKGYTLARNMPTLKALRAEYGITARNWQDAVPQMEEAIAKRIESLELAYNA